MVLLWNARLVEWYYPALAHLQNVGIVDAANAVKVVDKVIAAQCSQHLKSKKAEAVQHGREKMPKQHNSGLLSASI